MMTIKDIGTVLELLEANYGTALYKDASRDKVVKLWSVMFADDDPEEVLVAVKDCIATLQFPPRIADIKSRISQSRMAGQLTEMEAWAMVYKAVMESTRIGKAQTEFAKLPPIAQELVALPEQLLDWHEASGEVLTTVVASNFMRSYKIKAQREASYHALPADIQKAETWKLPKEQEKPKELPMSQFKYDENGNRVLNIGFEPPEYMMSSVKRWMAAGESDAEIRKACVNFGSYSPASDAPKPEQEDDKDKGMTLEEYLKLYPFEA